MPAQIAAATIGASRNKSIKNAGSSLQRQNRLCANVMKKKHTEQILVKWSYFWHSLSNAEKLVIMRFVGYNGQYPRAGISAMLAAELLILSLIVKRVSQNEILKVE